MGLGRRRVWVTKSTKGFVFRLVQSFMGLRVQGFRADVGPRGLGFAWTGANERKPGAARVLRKSCCSGASQRRFPKL